jgi:aromatic ring-opening dioxygenase LigB subunit
VRTTATRTTPTARTGSTRPRRSSTGGSSSSSERLDRLLELDPGLVADAKADSYWQLLLLAGALGGHGTIELLSYEAPSYYGMLTAAISF